MGTELLAFYNDRMKRSWKTAFFSAFVLGFLVHVYKFTNLLPNADAMYNFYSSQNMVASGRWFLSAACGISSYFDLPWINGLLSLVFMGVTAAMVAEVFRMENPVLIILSSGLLVSFPAMTATMSYEFTADGYMLAMALAALSVCLTRMEYIGKQHWPKMVLSGLCICLACGIYQAYVSFAFVLAVCYFISEIFGKGGRVGLTCKKEDKKVLELPDERKLLLWIGVQVLIYGCALAAYYIIWKLCLAVQGFTAVSYQGIDSVGVMGAGDLVQAFLKIARDFVLFFLEWNILEHGVTVYSVLNILFLISFVSVVLVAIYKSGIGKRKLHLFLLGLCLAALPVGCYLWYLTSPDVIYHGIMLQSVCLLYILTAVLFDRWAGPKPANLALVLLAAIVFHNSVNANKYYNYMHQSFVKTQAAAVELGTRIHLLDDGQIRYVAFYGSLENWSAESYMEPEELGSLGGWKRLSKTILSPMFLSVYTDFDLSYYTDNGLEYPVVENEPDIPAPQDWEFRFPLLDKAAEETLFQTEQVQQMPLWPARDSVQVLGDTVVVKLSEIEGS